MNTMYMISSTMRMSTQIMSTKLIFATVSDETQLLMSRGMMPSSMAPEPYMAMEQFRL